MPHPRPPRGHRVRSQVKAGDEAHSPMAQSHGPILTTASCCYDPHVPFSSSASRGRESLRAPRSPQLPRHHAVVRRREVRTQQGMRWAGDEQTTP